MKQVYEPNISVAATRGWCLKYIDDAGNAPNRTATARYAFQVEQKAGRIKTSEIPENVWVVGWLDFTSGMYTEYGHVFFIRRTGGSYQIYDSEVQGGARKPYSSLNELLAWFGAYGPKYIGWSTDCDGRTYVKEEETMKVTLDVARCLAYWAGRDGRDGRQNARKGDSDADLNKWHVNAELNQDFIFGWMNSKEHSDHIKRIDAVYKERDTLRGQVKDLQARVKELEAQPSGEFVKLSEIYIKK